MVKNKNSLNQNTRALEKVDSSLKLLAKSSVWLFVGIVLSKLLTYVYRIIIARNFGPQEYGLFSLALMVISWFVTISSFGIVDGIIRYIPLYRGKNEINKINHLIRFSFKFLLISGLLSALILFSFSDLISIRIFHDITLSLYLKIFSILIPITIFWSLLLSILQAYEEIKIYSYLRNIQDIAVRLIILLILVYIGLKRGAIILSYCISMFLMLIVSYYFVKKKVPSILIKSSLNENSKKEINKQLFSYSWPLIFVSIISFILTWIDSLSIGYYNVNGQGVYNVGIYNSAVPLAGLFIIASSLFTQLFFPIITKEYGKKNFKLIEELSKQISKWIFMINLPFLILMILFPGAVINFFFGSQYLAAENSLRFLSVGMFFYSIFIISENLLSMAGKSKIVLIDILFAAVFNFILNSILVPRNIIFLGFNFGGLTGAAFATMITYIIWGLLSLFQARYYTSIIALRKKIILITFVSIIPTILMIFIKQAIPLNKITLILQGVFFILVYTLLLIITGCLDRNDIMILQSIKNKFSSFSVTYNE